MPCLPAAGLGLSQSQGPWWVLSVPQSASPRTDHVLGLFSQAKYLTKKTQAASVEAVKMLDEILLQLSVSSLGAGGQ